MSHINDTPISSKQIYLDSKDATFKNDDNSNCLFYFKENLSPPHNVDMIASVQSFTCPMSFYIINATNNFLVWNTQSNSGSVTIPFGNYTITELVDFLKTQLTFLNSITYDKKTSKILFQKTTYSAGENSKTFIFANASTCFTLLGLNSSYNATSSGNDLQHSLLSENVVDLSGINSIYIHSNLLTYSLDSRSGGLSNILCRVPIDTDRNGLLHFNPQESYKTILRNKVIDYISIKLEDDEERSIDFNGLDWAITLQIDYRYIKTTKPMATMKNQSLPLTKDGDSNKINSTPKI